MEAAAQMRRVTQGIGEMVNYLQYNRDILFSDSRDDIFHLFFAMAVQQSQKKQDISEIKKRLLNMVDVMTKLDVYDKKTMADFLISEMSCFWAVDCQLQKKQMKNIISGI